jgi:hypothetical protein
MQTIGTDDAGFSVTWDDTEKLVRVVGWGFWDADIASVFDKTVIDVCLYVPVGAKLSMDMSRLKPMRDEGQKAFGATIRMLKDSKITHVAVLTASQLTKLQLMRIAREHAPKELVQFM